VSFSLRLTVAAGSEEAGRRKQMEQAAGVGRRCRVASGCGRRAGTRCSRGAAQRLVSAGQVRDGAEEPQGDATHRDAPAGVDAQRRRRQATGSLSLCSLSPLFFTGSLSVRSLSFSLCCCFYLRLLRKGANPSRALLSFPRRIPLACGFPSRAGPASAPARSRLTTKASART